MIYCYFDTETRSPIPISRGADAYMEPAECIMVQWALGDAPVSIWEPLSDTRWLTLGLLPDSLEELINDPNVLFVAHNAGFDRRVMTKLLKRVTPIGRWRCTMAQSRAHGGPGSLQGVGGWLGLTEEQAKLSSGKELIQLFCIPCDDGTYVQPWDRSGEWLEFVRYGRQDVSAMRYIHGKMPTHNYQGENLQTWMVNELANERGFKYDTDLGEACVKLLEIAKKRDSAKIQKETWNEALQLSEVEAVTQRNKLLAYLQKKIPIPNMKAATIREWLGHDDLAPEVRFVLTMRLEAAKSAGSKYGKGLSIKGWGDRLRYCLQFSGAGRTGRFSHKNFQPGNMARRSKKYGKRWAELVSNILNGVAEFMYDDLNTVCADVLRASITATDKDSEMVVADLSNIESRVLAWIADETWKLEAYRAVDAHVVAHGKECKCGQAPDLYELLFSKFFGVAVELVDEFQRQSGKVSELAFGFGGGVGALVVMAAVYAMNLSALPDMILPNAKPEYLKKAEKAYRRALMSGDDFELEPRVYMALDVLKQVYRESNKGIDTLRKQIGEAVKESVREPGSVFKVGKCTIWATSSFLIIQLPSGRRLLYSNPKLVSKVEIDPETLKERRSEYVTYMTARGKHWVRESAWDGLYLENIVQAIANDVLRWAMVRVHKETKKIPAIQRAMERWKMETAIVLHVHDEIACDTPKGALTLEQLVGWLTQGDAWNKGLPLAAAGYINYRYGAK